MTILAVCTVIIALHRIPLYHWFLYFYPPTDC